MSVDTDASMAMAAWRRKKRNLNSWLRESWLSYRFRADRCEERFDFDWRAIPHTRATVVNLLLAGNRDGRYLEIGCAGNELFDAVMTARKTGVDPVRGGTHRLTSDAFFAQSADERFDVIFIDGLHLFEQVHRDVVNALAALAPGGWIAIHDMLPRDWLEEHVPQISTAAWTGDGWKVAFELLASPELEFRLLSVDHGVAVIRPKVAGARLADLGAALGSERFSYLHRHFERLPVVDYAAGRDWIGSHGALHSGEVGRRSLGKTK
jgi:SAM-dependent methyltransferase